MEIPRDCKRGKKKGVEMEEGRDVLLGMQRAVQLDDELVDEEALSRHGKKIGKIENKLY